MQEVALLRECRTRVSRKMVRSLGIELKVGQLCREQANYLMGFGKSKHLK